MPEGTLFFVPCWREGLPLGAPRRIWPWLAERGSLTARIRAHCRDFAVRRLFEGWGRPYPDEAIALDVPVWERVRVREVALLADGAPVVFARSLATRQGLRYPWRLLQRIGNRPLGAALFTDPTVHRGTVQTARLDVRDPRYHRASALYPATPPGLWARRSLFWRAGAPLLVSEVFLPPIDLLIAPT
ncbi:MAG: chorismate lyase [Rhodocyclales bacterium]|nr:chorismate lyase [Rhodocyclales bacterium]